MTVDSDSLLCCKNLHYFCLIGFKSGKECKYLICYLNVLEFNMSDDESRDSRGDTETYKSDSSDNICRDFLRNVCKRGRRCKYRHPDSNETEELGRKVRYVFCHDYQNKECRRVNCKFLHCTRNEEQQYRLYGRLPSHLVDAVAMGKGIPFDAPSKKGEIPICKDFLKGDCRRAGRCKFRHIIETEQVDSPHLWRRKKERFGSFEKYEVDEYEPEPKRQAFDHYANNSNYISGNDKCSLVSSAVVPLDYQLLEEENTLLRHKIEELKKQVTELQATNEFLLDQNAQLRLSKQTTVSPVTQTLNPHTATPLPSAITQISQQLSLGNNDLTGATTTLPTQHIATELAAATQQTITPIVPVTLGQAIAPVSIATVPVSIASVPVSIAQALPAAVSLSQTLPQSIITMSGPSTPLVSYPIMTQSMRPVITHSLGR